jgi:predicted RNase H-like HicB family nuclease
MENGQYIEVTFEFTEEDGMYAATCRELGTASCGDTLDEAVRNIRDAVTLHIDSLTELGKLERVLSEQGVHVRRPDAASTPVPSLAVPVGVLVFRQQAPVQS